MASGGIRKVSRIVKGTGASLDVKGIGFSPKHVVVANLTTGVALEWTDAMPVAAGIKTAAAGDRTYVTSAGITPIADGVNLGTDSVNGSTNDLSIICTD